MQIEGQKLHFSNYEQKFDVKNTMQPMYLGYTVFVKSFKFRQLYTVIILSVLQAVTYYIYSYRCHSLPCQGLYLRAFCQPEHRHHHP